MEAGEIYQRPITATLIAIWQRELAHIAEHILRTAFRLVLRDCPFFPTPADVHRFVPRNANTESLTLYSGPRQLDYGDATTVLCDACRNTGWVVGDDGKARLCKCKKRDGEA